MSKVITFMRKDIYSEQLMSEAEAFIAPLFENEGEEFKRMLGEGSVYLEGKSFTYIKHPQKGKLYRLMGNCIGPIVYVRDILDLE